MVVFLLVHIRHAQNPDGSIDHVDENGELVWDEEDGDDLKTLGVYSSERRARERIERARGLPGFDLEPDCFLITEYVVDADDWAEGFVSIPRDQDKVRGFALGQDEVVVELGTASTVTS